MRSGGILFLSLLLVVGRASADYSGRVVAIVSGDTLEVLREGKRQRVHLADAACPKKGKRFAETAKRYAAEQTLDTVVQVVERGRARGAARGEILLPGNRSLSRELVRAGLAWANPEGSGDDLGYLESEARAARRGLWADPDPASPWAEKKRKKSR